MGMYGHVWACMGMHTYQMHCSKRYHRFFVRKLKELRELMSNGPDGDRAGARLRNICWDRDWSTDK